jgi:hypothetical protein
MKGGGAGKTRTNEGYRGQVGSCLIKQWVDNDASAAERADVMS